MARHIVGKLTYRAKYSLVTSKHELQPVLKWVLIKMGGPIKMLPVGPSQDCSESLTSLKRNGIVSTAGKAGSFLGPATVPTLKFIWRRGHSSTQFEV